MKNLLIYPAYGETFNRIFHNFRLVVAKLTNFILYLNGPWREYRFLIFPILRIPFKILWKIVKDFWLINNGNNFIGRKIVVRSIQIYISRVHTFDQKSANLCKFPSIEWIKIQILSKIIERLVEEKNRKNGIE